MKQFSLSRQMTRQADLLAASDLFGFVCRWVEDGVGLLGIHLGLDALPDVVAGLVRGLKEKAGLVCDVLEIADERGAGFAGLQMFLEIGIFRNAVSSGSEQVGKLLLKIGAGNFTNGLVRRHITVSLRLSCMGRRFGVTKQFAKLEAGFVELRFAVAGGALEHGGDLIVLEAFYIVKDEDHAVAGRERGDGALEGYAVDGAGEVRVAAAEVALGASSSEGLMVSSRETRLQALFAKVHEDEIDRKAMEPCGEGGFAAEAADLAEEMEEGVLGHVFGFGDVAEHAEAKGVDAAFVEGVELGKCLGVSVFLRSRWLRLRRRSGDFF